MAGVYDVLEVCDWADLQELAESGQHEGIVIARERYKRFQVPRSPGQEVTRPLQTKALGDQIDGNQGLIGPPGAFVRELIPFHVGHIETVSGGQKVDANLGRSLGACFCNSDVNA